MKIGQPLPQFENERAFFIVSGDKSAQFYLAKSGEIEKLDSFEVEKPTYLDREGFFMKSGHGRVFGSGSVVEDFKKEIEDKFKKELEKRAGTILKKEKPDGLYLFFPRQSSGLVLEALPKSAEKKIKMCLWGNFVSSHPIDLIRKIQGVFDECIGLRVPRKKEARKILEKVRA